MKRGREAASLVAGVSGVDVCLVREHLVVRLSLYPNTQKHAVRESERVRQGKRVSLSRSLALAPPVSRVRACE